MRAFGSIVWQILVLCAIGFVVGLSVNGAGGVRHIAANAGLSEKDNHDYIDLFKDYFRKPKTALPSGSPTSGDSPQTAGGIEGVAEPEAGTVAELPVPDGGQAAPADGSDDAGLMDLLAPTDAHPFREVTLEQAIEIFKQAEAGRGFIVFVDARPTEPYEAGRIPGAMQCDYYREGSVNNMLPWIQGAQKVVVYCNGGDCEDSLYVCGELLNSEVPWHTVYLFKGGWEAWKASGQPIQTGPAEE